MVIKRERDRDAVNLLLLFTCHLKQTHTRARNVNTKITVQRTGMSTEAVLLPLCLLAKHIFIALICFKIVHCVGLVFRLHFFACASSPP